jgi:NTP pyrophosphatase (non-canonical NTP hydrolase)
MPDTTTTVTELKDLVNQFIAERDWFKFHDPKNLSMSIAIEAAELLEHFQWVRSEELDKVTNDPASRQQIEEELSDIFAFLLSFANRLNIDMSEALKKKMAKNALKYPTETFKGKYKI